MTFVPGRTWYFLCRICVVPFRGQSPLYRAIPGNLLAEYFTTDYRVPHTGIVHSRIIQSVCVCGGGVGGIWSIGNLSKHPLPSFIHIVSKM